MATPQPPRPQWRKSSHSANSSTCVEVATNLPAVIAVRDSQHPDTPTLTFTRTAWASFTARIRQNQS